MYRCHGNYLYHTEKHKHGDHKKFELTCHGNYLCLTKKKRKKKHGDHKKLRNRPVMEIICVVLKNTKMVTTRNLEINLSWKLSVLCQKTQTWSPQESSKLTCHGNYSCHTKKHKHGDHKNLRNRV